MNTDEYGRTPLHYAALDGDLEKVSELIETGIDLDAQCKQGWSALHCAAETVSPEVAAALVQAGANIEARDIYGNTPLWRAVMAAKSNGSVIELLLKDGANPDSANESGVSPLSLATSIGNYDLVQFFERKL